MGRHGTAGFTDGQSAYLHMPLPLVAFRLSGAHDVDWLKDCYCGVVAKERESLSVEDERVRAKMRRGFTWPQTSVGSTVVRIKVSMLRQLRSLEALAIRSVLSNMIRNTARLSENRLSVRTHKGQLRRETEWSHRRTPKRRSRVCGEKLIAGIPFFPR